MDYRNSVLATTIGGSLALAAWLATGYAQNPKSVPEARETYRSTEIVGTEVRNVQGEDLGEIGDVVVNGDGRVLYVVVSQGGVMDMGEQLVAIPWNAIHPSSRGEYYVVNINKERLASAPNFKPGEWDLTDNHRWNEFVYNYYGYDYDQYVATGPAGSDDMRRERVTTAFSALDANSDGYLNRSEASGREGLADRFDQADRNEDGWISSAEFSAFETQEFTGEETLPAGEATEPERQEDAPERELDLDEF